MITVGSSALRLDRALLGAPGGFAWWYLDVLDEHGSGVVVIAAFGLPFLPGYASSAQRGEAPAAGDRPSLNIAVYERGEPVFYLLQEHDSDAASWVDDGEGARIGASRFRSRQEGDRRVVDVTLDVEVPRMAERLTGTIRIDGPALQSVGSGASGAHEWTPLTTACTGLVDLELGGRELLRTEGRAYHDRNGSPQPLQALGIAHWIWGRTPVNDGELIHYLLWPEDKTKPVLGLLLEVSADGSVVRHSDMEVEISKRRSGWFGMPWWREVVLRKDGVERLRLRHRRVVDDGFFYLRFTTEVQHAGGTALGVGEAVRPSRVDLGWQRPLVRMAVHHASRPNSMWLPLFSGPAAGRWSRLFEPRRLTEVSS